MAAHSKNFVILACIVSIRLQSVMDGRTDRHTNDQAMAKMREAFCYLA